MTGDYVLYGGGITRSVAVEVILRELKLPYELVEIDAARGEHRAPGFLRINPAGYLPALATPSGEVLHENAAVRRCFELAAERPKSGALILDLQRKARDARDQR